MDCVSRRTWNLKRLRWRCCPATFLRKRFLKQIVKRFKRSIQSSLVPPHHRLPRMILKSVRMDTRHTRQKGDVGCENAVASIQCLVAAPAEKRQKLLSVYRKFEPQFGELVQKAKALEEQKTKDMLKIIAPDTK